MIDQESSTPRLSMRGVTKRFGATVALDGVDLDVVPGEIHALVGENGAGKSTLMRILSGAEEPDAGSMSIDGEDYAPASPRDGRDRGVAMIYQELNLASDLTVEANVCLGAEANRRGWLDRRANRQRANEALAMLGETGIRPWTRTGRLGPGQRQLVEIARALATDARILVLDEPTSSLSQADAHVLFEVVRRLAGAGVAVIYISHFLEEIEAIAERFSVLRDGAVVASGDVADVQRAQIVRWMVGREVDEMFPRVAHVRGDAVLDIRELRGVRLPRGCDLTLHRGEIAGVFGLVGAGRTELLRAVYGLDRVRSGSVRVAEIDVTHIAVHERMRRGLGFVSEDRKSEGLALDQSIADNLTYGHTEPCRRYGILRTGVRRRIVREWIGRLSIRARGPGQSVAALSGGNQQKVALARVLYRDADVLLLDEPTRGVDVGSKVEIYRWIGELAARGKAVLLVSSYLPELLGITDRVAVMHRGVLSAFVDTAQATAESLMALATQGEERA